MLSSNISHAYGVFDKFIASEKVPENNSSIITSKLFEIVENSRDLYSYLRINSTVVDISDCSQENRMLFASMVILNLDFQNLDDKYKAKAKALIVKKNYTSASKWHQLFVYNLFRQAASVLSTRLRPYNIALETGHSDVVDIFAESAADERSYFFRLPKDITNIIQQNLRHSSPRESFNLQGKRIQFIDRLIIDGEKNTPFFTTFFSIDLHSLSKKNNKIFTNFLCNQLMIPNFICLTKFYDYSEKILKMRNEKLSDTERCKKLEPFEINKVYRYYPATGLILVVKILSPQNTAEILYLCTNYNDKYDPEGMKIYFRKNIFFPTLDPHSESQYDELIMTPYHIEEKAFELVERYFRQPALTVSAT